MKTPFEAVEPCEELKKYVACYYFIKSDDPNFSSQHYSFPHTFNALSIYKDSSFHSKPSNFKAEQSKIPNCQIFVQVKKQAPLMVRISGKVNRATILFKDFGINHFINGPLSKVMGYDAEQFNSWQDDPLFDPFIADLFHTNDLKKKGECIDHFLLQRLKHIELYDLEKAVALLCDFEQNLSVNEIADQLAIPIRTFNRKFKETLGVSPITYKRIAQFRNSLNDKLFNSQFKKLTEIGYHNNFYDQSYFIKMYRKLAGSNPKVFFNTIEKLGNDQLIFQFIKNQTG